MRFNTRLRNVTIGSFMLCWGASALSQDAMVRLRCEGDSLGADVFINDKLKGPCPSDLVLAEGTIKLRVMKNLKEGRYRAFEKDFFLAAGAVQRINVVLGGVQLTAEGRKLEQVRIEAETVAAEKEKARQAVLREEARIQAEKDAPRTAAEKLRAENEAAIAREAARRAEPGAVKKYFLLMSTKGPDANPISATLLTVYAPLFLPISTVSDLVDGKNIAMADPSVFGNPDSMIAKSMRLQIERHQQPETPAATLLAKR
jgi:hypothetical protein